MKKNNLIFFFLIFMSGNLFAQNDISANYSWDPIRVGNGGWATGMDIHPSGSPVYFRSDVGGAYRLNAAGTAWTQIVTEFSMPAEEVNHNAEIWNANTYGGVLSIVSAPSDANRAYMVFQTTVPIPSNEVGCVFISDDQGNSWNKTNLCSVYVGANDEGRTTGERLAVDPQNAENVFFATQSDGLWYTRDGGDNWNQINLGVIPSGNDGFGVTNIIFDESGGITNGLTNNLFATVNDTGIYFSDDTGITWIRIDNRPNGPTLNNGHHIEEAVVNSTGTLYLTADYQIMRYQDENWTALAPFDNYYTGIAIDPFNENRIYVSQENGQCLRSTDGGQNWDELLQDVNSTDVDWVNEYDNRGWISIGELLFDPVSPGKLWLAQGFGIVNTTDINDGEIMWESVNVGTEALVSNDIIVPPNGNILTATWDLPLWKITDPSTYTAEQINPNNRFNSGWDLDYSMGNPNFIVGVVDDHRFCCPDGAQQSGYSADGGNTWNVFPSILNGTHPAALEFGNIAVDGQNTDNIVWLPSFNGNPHFTMDGGTTWTAASLPGMSTGGHHAYFLEKKVLMADAVTSGTFYLYHWESGLFISTDGGATWTASSASLPIDGWHAQLAAVPGKAGHLLFTLGVGNEAAEIYYSTDQGQNFTLLNSPKASAITAGASINNSSAFYAAGVFNEEEGIFRSSDLGLTWDKIGTYPAGIYAQITTMAADQIIPGKVYVGVASSGYFIGTDNFLTALPIEEGNLKATTQERSTLIAWETLSEENASHFEIEAKADGSEFKKIGSVRAVGFSNRINKYKFIHNDPQIGHNYYRIRSVDFDGTYAYSKIVSVFFDPSEKVKMYPNPVRDYLYLEAEIATKVDLFDGRGQLVSSWNLDKNQNKEINLVDLPAGVYWLNWNNGTRMKNRKIMKH